MRSPRGNQRPPFRTRAAVPAPRGRSGWITVELILNLPIWMLMTLAVVQFGELASKLQHVSLASRAGADAAAETAALPFAGGVPANVVQAVERQLASAHIACQRIVLEHNVAQQPSALVTGNAAQSTPRRPLPHVGRSVRVSVYVRPDAMVPNLLGAVGVDLWSQTLEQSTTLRYRLPTTERKK